MPANLAKCVAKATTKITENNYNKSVIYVRKWKQRVRVIFRKYTVDRISYFAIRLNERNETMEKNTQNRKKEISLHDSDLKYINSICSVPLVLQLVKQKQWIKKSETKIKKPVGGVHLVMFNEGTQKIFNEPV